ncbi:MAG: EutN/CcmL family microcompartment protein [Planctomycetes bacterium]|nr:EutN/CcmL family microcompartment protein [Planctomycetota bacterium]
MQIGLVIGTANATVKHPSLEGWKMLVVQMLGADGKSPDGDPLLAVDAMGAGLGERVMLTSDGASTRELLKSETTPVRWTVLGICDE